MQTVLLHRDHQSDEGTLGKVFVNFKPFCHSLELPSRDNQVMLSRIPAGKYRCAWHKSNKFGWVYRVTSVPSRSHILIHPANWAGDRMKGFKCHLHGCIGLGMKRGRLSGQRAVLASRLAVNKFTRIMNKKPFDLIIVDGANS